MEDIYVIEHIKELCKQKGWSYYKLAKESQIPYSSLNNMITRQHIPSMNNLIKICKGFNITLSQFFSYVESTDEQTELFTELLNVWNLLDKYSKKLALSYMYGLAETPLSIEDIRK